MPTYTIRLTAAELVALRNRAATDDRSMQRYIHRLLFPAQRSEDDGVSTATKPAVEGRSRLAGSPDCRPRIIAPVTQRAERGNGPIQQPRPFLGPTHDPTFRPAPKPGKR